MTDTVEYLELQGGRRAEVSVSPTGISLSVVFRNDMKPNLTVHAVREADKTIGYAFCFNGKGGKYYPAVEKDSTSNEVCMKIVGPIKKPFDRPPQTYLFKYNSNGVFGSLRSVAEPGQFLSVSEKGEHFILSSIQDPRFRFRSNTSTDPVRSIG